MTDLSPATTSDGRGRTRSGPVCRFCGSSPAVAAVFERQTGMVFLRKSEVVPGPFCRDCGLSWFRATTAHTLAIGWLGFLSFFAAPYVVVRNVLERRKVARLGPGQSPSGMRPLNPGRPVFLRAQAALALIPLAAAVMFTVNLVADLPSNQVGKCVTGADAGVATMSGTFDAVFVDCEASHIGVVTAAVDDESECPEGTFATVERHTRAGLLCLG